MAGLHLSVRKMCQEENKRPWMGFTGLPFSVQEFVNEEMMFTSTIHTQEG